MMKLVVALCLIGISAAYVVPVYYEIYPEDAVFEDAEIEQLSPVEFQEGSIRERRSLQPGAPSFPMPGGQLPTSVSGNVEKQGRNTIATIGAEHKTDRYDVRGTWTKVVHGPAKSKPNFSIGGSYRW